MTLEEYLEFLKTHWNSSHRPLDMQKIHASMGLSGEAGEVLEWHKKKFFHDRDMTHEDLVSEFGDVFYYLMRLATLHNVTLEQIMQSNAAKIVTRKEKKEGAWSGKTT